jgi:phosphopantothenoylcysteine decarboxylase/phosphopantothenate--cysteine ligase
MGPGRAKLINTDRSRISVKEFFFYDELDMLLETHLGQTRYDIIIHSVAVADYRPTDPFSTKILSGWPSLRVELSPTPKLVDKIRARAEFSLLVAFKLEVGKTARQLIALGWESLRRHRTDLVVANDFERINDNTHVAWIIDSTRCIIRVESKTQLCDHLTTEAARRL